MRGLRLLISLLALAVLAVGFVPASLGAQEAGGPTEAVVVRLYYSDRAQLNAVAGEVDIWEVHHEAGYAVAAVTPGQYHWLVDLGYQVQIDREKTALLGIQAPLDPRFYYFDSFYSNIYELYMVDFLQLTNATYPDLTELIDIGDGWQASHGGHHRDLWVLRITNEDPAFGDIVDKPPFYLMSNIHAREVTTPEMAIRYIKYLTTGYDGAGGYGIDPDVTWLVDWNVIYVEVSQNPDGHWQNEWDIGNNWRKNMNNTLCPGGRYGIDLNRNHSFFWGCCGGSSGDPCNVLYRGPSRASEPETQAYQDYFATIFTDWNGPNGDDEYGSAAPDDASGVMITLHTYSDLVLWPWGHTSNQAPNGAQLRTIGRKLAYFNDYTPQQGYSLYPTDGTTDDWSYGKFGVASFTFEIGPSYGNCGGFFPAYECMEGEGGYPRNFWAENGPAFLYAHKIARTPYMTSYGPDTQDLVLDPNPVEQGTPVDLTALIQDYRYGGDPLATIGAAEYFVDEPGADGTGTAMSPQDGSWGGTSETAIATVDTSSLDPGTHYILVHGKKQSAPNDHWGPFTAIFLYIVEPGVSPTIEGYVRDASNNLPLDATVTAGSFHTDTDPATGYYSMTVISGTYDMNAVAAGYAISIVTGIEAHNYETVRQDFYLSPICEIFADDVESGNQGWTPEGQWAITTESSHSPSHSWTDSPGDNYGNNWNYSLISPIFDLSDYIGVALDFWHIYDLEDGYDYGYLEISTNGGGNWTQVASYNGEDQTTWMHEGVALAQLDDQSNARIRFRIDTDTYVREDGWHVDDVVLTGGGPACFTPLAPAAEFTSNSPVDLGEPMVFTNLTTGTVPIEYLWEFGDGVTSTLEHPAHIYGTAGTFTVTLSATNAYGSDDVSHPVIVLPGACVPLTEVTILGPTGGEPGVYTFTTTYEPPEATPPIGYLWDNGDVTAFSVRSLDVGSHTLTVTASNCTDTVVVDSHTIVITQTPVCTEVSGVDLTLVTTGTIRPGDEVEFSADIAPDDAVKPYTYRVTIDGAAGPTLSSGLDPLVFTHTFDLTGTHEVGIAVWNCDMQPADAVTDAVTLVVYEPGVCVPLTGITILGPTSGEPGVYTFTTAYEPPAATLPIGYLWDNGDVTAFSVRNLVAGTHTLTVTASNCTDTVVLDTHIVVIQEPVTYYYIYLPVILRVGD